MLCIPRISASPTNFPKAQPERIYDKVALFTVFFLDMVLQWRTFLRSPLESLGNTIWEASALMKLNRIFFILTELWGSWFGVSLYTFPSSVVALCTQEYTIQQDSVISWNIVVIRACDTFSPAQIWPASINASPIQVRPAVPVSSTLSQWSAA